MEPIFKQRFSENENTDEAVWLVPQIEIVLSPEKPKKQDKKEEKGPEQPQPEKRSLLDLAHRTADAVVQSCPTLKNQFEAAFESLRRRGDAGPLCALAPTSLVFGVWDSRGGSGEKRPRLVRAVIRAWDVDELHAAAQFNSVWKALDKEQQDELKKQAKSNKVKLSVKGFADAPAVISKNTGARVLGGVLVRDRIEREVTVNLLALRNIRGASSDETVKIKKYLLGLRSSRPPTRSTYFCVRAASFAMQLPRMNWCAVPRRGTTTKVNLGSTTARPSSFNSLSVLRSLSGRNGPRNSNTSSTSRRRKNFSARRTKTILMRMTSNSCNESYSSRFGSTMVVTTEPATGHLLLLGYFKPSWQVLARMVH